jgi:hypothetical protein
MKYTRISALVPVLLLCYALDVHASPSSSSSSSESTTSIGDRVQANFFALVDMPLTTTQATQQGWTRIEKDHTACNQLYGFRYRYKNRLSPTMLFNHIGQVAGIQFAIDTTTGPPLYPGSSLKAFPTGPVFQQSSDVPNEQHVYIFTAHFSDPNTLCSAATPLPAGSVGDRVWSRQSEAGNNAQHFYEIPLERTGLVASDGWVASGCMRSGDFNGLTMNGMGQHYWRYAHHAMKSTDFYPWFLLYDQHDRLNMFGASISGPVAKWPTASGQQDNSWKQTKVPVSGAQQYSYPHANTSELWTYPTSPLVPYFHFANVLPLNSVYMNTLDPTKPGGMFATSTMHIVLRDSSNVTNGACAEGTSREAFDYAGFKPDGEGKGTFSLEQACKEEEALWLGGGGTGGGGDGDEDALRTKVNVLAALVAVMAAAGLVGTYRYCELRKNIVRQQGLTQGDQFYRMN